MAGPLLFFCLIRQRIIGADYPLIRYPSVDRQSLTGIIARVSDPTPTVE